MTPISNLPGRAPLDIQQGADLIRSFALTAAGVAVDLTGSSLAAQLRKCALDPAVAASFVIVVNSPPTLGSGTLSIPASVTAKLLCGPTLIDEASRYWWDLKLTDSNGLVTVLLSGEARVYRAVTR
jgi:hypothetical protein